MALINSFTKAGSNTDDKRNRSPSTDTDSTDGSSADLPRMSDKEPSNESFGSKANDQDGNIASSVAANLNAKAQARRWKPKKKSSLFKSFTSKRNHRSRLSSDNHSSSLNSDSLSPGDASSLNIDINSLEDDLSGILGENNDDGNSKEAREKEVGSAVERHRPIPRPSIVSSDGSSSEESSSFYLGDGDDLDLGAHAGSHIDSETLLAKLGNSPSAFELANLAAVRAKECINEYLYDDNDNTSKVLDLKRWEGIPQFAKSELKIQKHLGKGCFSDAFEVSVKVIVEEKKFDSSDKEDLDELIEAKFGTSKNVSEEVEAEDDLDRQIEAMFAPPPSAPKKPAESQFGRVVARRPGRNLHQSMDQGVSASLCVRGTQSSTRPVQKKLMTYAMKCLRPQIRSNADQFIIGIEDLVHETAMLASLDHPNIIKLHGRAVTDASRLGDGYFILLDRLQHTLEEQMKRWNLMRESEINLAKMGMTGGTSPWPHQLETASSVADALSYLHSKNVAFRDLKPANVGFDSRGAVKLFDFGFSVVVEGDADDLLQDVCGTPRYMAPEVGLGRGYSLPVDVYSFGILLWEILSLKKPFRHIKSVEGFEKQIFEKGVRPKMERAWDQCLKGVMRECWSAKAGERPTMEIVAGMLRAHIRESPSAPDQNNDHISLLKKSLMFRRHSG